MSDSTTPQDSAAMSPASDGSHVGLRDYFAAASLMSGHSCLDDEGLARRCYRVADAMLRERGKPTLTDAEREAVAYFGKIEGGQYLDAANRHAATLRGLLQRTK
jgi:hypothetical protein